MSETIEKFEGEYEWLSNFYPAPFTVEGTTYPTLEHYYQSQKTMDPKERAEIIAAPTAGKAKRLGKATTLREDWEDEKETVMAMGIYYKSTNHPELIEKLITTSDAILIEGNIWGDKYWGVCDGEGENRLGELLMKFRLFSAILILKNMFSGIL